MTRLNTDIGYGATSISPTVALPIGAADISLDGFQVGSNFNVGAETELQLSPSKILDITPLFWLGQPNSFWFKTHDDRDFTQKVVLENDDNSLTLDTVEVTSHQIKTFTRAMSVQADALKKFILTDMAPVYLSYKNAMWVAQQELRTLTGDDELQMTADMEPTYMTLLRKAFKYKLAEYVCNQLGIPDSMLPEIAGREQQPSAETELRKMMQQVVQDIGGTNVNPVAKAKT